MPEFAPPVTFSRLVEKAEFRFLLFRRYMFPRRNNSNHVAGSHPVDIITWTNSILLRDGLRNSDLVLGCNLSHVSNETALFLQ